MVVAALKFILYLCCSIFYVNHYTIYIAFLTDTKNKIHRHTQSAFLFSYSTNILIANSSSVHHKTEKLSTIFWKGPTNGVSENLVIKTIITKNND